MVDILRNLAPPVLAVASAVLIDRLAWRRGMRPPAFCVNGSGGLELGRVRRSTAVAVVAVILWLGVYAPLGMLGDTSEFDPASISTAHLFLLHVLLLATAAAWYVLGFGLDGRGWLRQFGLRARRPLTEVVLGIGCGVAAWMAVILVMILTGLGLWALGGRDLLPQSAPPLIPWLAGLPLFVRLLISLSAGVSEELFFRGFLQPRAGVFLSTALFVLAHLSYEQPFMLLGVTLLSLIFAGLVVWRQSVWAAVAAHATFDAIQLTIMIPWALRNLEGDALPVLGALL